ncbi:MAG: hypothetical protein PW843_29080 [Azospirillaceae bacterium]|nr:hypothetical protein [Azospirillaceae bacterium]
MVAGDDRIGLTDVGGNDVHHVFGVGHLFYIGYRTEYGDVRRQCRHVIRQRADAVLHGRRKLTVASHPEIFG